MNGDAHNPGPMNDGTGPTLFPAVSARTGGMAVAAALAAAGLVFAGQASLLDFGDFKLPGPGFFPLVLGGLVFILASIVGVRLWLGADEAEPVALGHRDVLIVFAAMLAVPLLFEPLGAYATLGMFGAALLVLVANTPAVVAALSAAAGMAACRYFFQVALGLQLPSGSLWDKLTQLSG